MFIDEIYTRLVATGVGTSANIYKGSGSKLPELGTTGGEGPMMTLVDTGGSGGATTQTDTGTEIGTLQLTARAAAYPAAYNMAKAAWTALGGVNGLHNITLSSSVFYLRIKARQNPTDIGTDDDGRSMVVFNIEAEKQPS